MKLKLSTLKSLYDNVVALDGFQKAVEIDGKSTLVFERHAYGERFTWNRVKALRVLRTKLEDLEALRITIAKRYLDKPTDEKVPVAKETAFRAELAKALEIVEDVKGLLKFPKEDLNLFDPKENPSGNKIASSILDALEPFIEAA